MYLRNTKQHMAFFIFIVSLCGNNHIAVVIKSVHPYVQSTKATHVVVLNNTPSSVCGAVTQGSVPDGSRNLDYSPLPQNLCIVCTKHQCILQQTPAARKMLVGCIHLWRSCCTGTPPGFGQTKVCLSLNSCSSNST